MSINTIVNSFTVLLHLRHDFRNIFKVKHKIHSKSFIYQLIHNRVALKEY